MVALCRGLDSWLKCLLQTSLWWFFNLIQLSSRSVMVGQTLLIRWNIIHSCKTWFDVFYCLPYQISKFLYVIDGWGLLLTIAEKEVPSAPVIYFVHSSGPVVYNFIWMVIHEIIMQREKAVNFIFCSSLQFVLCIHKCCTKWGPTDVGTILCHAIQM